MIVCYDSSWLSKYLPELKSCLHILWHFTKYLLFPILFWYCWNHYLAISLTILILHSLCLYNVYSIFVIFSELIRIRKLHAIVYINKLICIVSLRKILYSLQRGSNHGPRCKLYKIFRKDTMQINLFINVLHYCEFLYVMSHDIIQGKRKTFFSWFRLTASIQFT